MYQWHNVSIIVDKKVKLNIGQNKWPVAIELRRFNCLCHLASVRMLRREPVKIWKEAVMTCLQLRS